MYVNLLTQTAQEIAAHHDVRVETDARLMERCFGVLQGQVYRGPAQKPEDTEGIEPSVAYVFFFALTQYARAPCVVLG